MNLHQPITGFKEFKKKVQSSVETYWAFVPNRIKETIRINAYTLWKIPLIAFLSPRVEDISDEKMTLKIPLNFRSKNHLGSMYFGALSIGADLTVGTLAMRHIEKSKHNIELIFKEFKAEFLKRAEADVIFVCEQGQEIADLVQKAIESKERVHFPIKATAMVPSLLGSEPVAKFTLTLSLKEKNTRKKSIKIKVASQKDSSTQNL